MALERYIDEQRRKGLDRAADAALAILQRFGDVPLVDEIDSRLPGFSAEARNGLEQRGYRVVTLSGGSIRDFLSQERRIMVGPGIDRDRTSRYSEVAIAPDLFLEGSDGENSEAQRALMASFSAQLKKDVPRVRALRGGHEDWVDLYVANNQRREGPSLPHGLVRTQTDTCVGRRQGGEPILVTDLPSSAMRTVYVAPLIVPA